jgi:hypothetical protein
VLLQSLLDDSRYSADVNLLRNIDIVIQSYANLRMALHARALRDDQGTGRRTHHTPSAPAGMGLAAKLQRRPKIICDRCHKAVECRVPAPAEAKHPSTTMEHPRPRNKRRITAVAVTGLDRR